MGVKKLHLPAEDWTGTRVLKRLRKLLHWAVLKHRRQAAMATELMEELQKNESAHVPATTDSGDGLQTVRPWTLETESIVSMIAHYELMRNAFLKWQQQSTALSPETVGTESEVQSPD